MRLRAGSSPARDTVEALTFLTAPATVQVTVGGTTTSCSVPAGPGTCTVPLAAGTVSAEVVRNGVEVAAVTSPSTVVGTPDVQDLERVGASSGRTGTRATATASVTPASTPKAVSRPAVSAPVRPARSAAAKAGTTVVLAPVADTYAHSWVPKGNFAASASLNVHGAPRTTSHLRFTVPRAPKGTRLTRATLRIRTNDLPFAGSTGTSDIALSSSAWTESSVVWGTRPLPTSRVVGRISGATAPSRQYGAGLSVGALSTLLGRQASLVLSSTSADDLWLWSSNHPDRTYRPALALTFS